MFEHIIENKIIFISEYLEDNNQYVTLQSVLSNTDIHSYVRKYFDAESDWLLYQERVALQNHVNFDFQSDEASQLIDDLMSYMKQNARFTRKSIQQIIGASVKTEINLLVRPRTTLKWFIFKNEPTKPIAEVKLKLKYLSEYSYLIEGIERWLEEKCAEKESNSIISSIEFERTVESIDNDAIFSLSPKEFVELLQPMFNFFADDNSQGTIPIEALIIFLEDKGIYILSEKFRKLRNEHIISELSPEDTLREICGVIEESESNEVHEETSLNENIMPDEALDTSFQDDSLASDSVVSISDEEMFLVDTKQNLELIIDSTIEDNYPDSNSEIDQILSNIDINILNSDVNKLDNSNENNLSAPLQKDDTIESNISNSTTINPIIDIKPDNNINNTLITSNNFKPADRKIIKTDILNPTASQEKKSFYDRFYKTDNISNCTEYLRVFDFIEYSRNKIVNFSGNINPTMFLSEE
jgi:hypothetical protein